MDSTQTTPSAQASPQTRAPVLSLMIADRAKSRAVGDVGTSGATSVSFERAAATALGRAAERQHRLPVFVESVSFGAMSLSELPEYLPDRALLTVVEAGRDSLGVMALCPAFLASLIEMQALGRITSRAPEPRRPTRTDAAISADFVNSFLAELGRELAGRKESAEFAQFRYATFVEDPRPLALMLEDGPMMRLTLRFRVGSGGQRDASIMIALPVSQPVCAPSPGGRLLPPATGTPAASAAIAPTLEQAVKEAPITVRGILCRCTLTLRALRGLSAGSVFPLPHHAINDASIETTRGQILARGRLGERDGFHAIRLRAPSSARDGSQSDAGAVAGPVADAPLGDLHHEDPFRSPIADQLALHRDAS